jgi:hypothetical protein
MLCQGKVGYNGKGQDFFNDELIKSPTLKNA